MRYLALIFVLACFSSIIYGQTPSPTPTPTDLPADENLDCGSGLPCGQVPWGLPSFPLLESPTPLDLGDGQVVNPGETPTPTVDFLAEITQIGEYASNLDSLTSTPFNFEVTEEAEYQNIIANSTLFFSYVKGLSQADFGVVTPLLSAFFIFVTLTILIKMTLFFIPIIGVIAGLIRKVIELIPGF